MGYVSAALNLYDFIVNSIALSKAKKSELKTVEGIGGKYSIGIPSFLSPTSKLTSTATLQYLNERLNIGYQILETPRSVVADGIDDIQGTLPCSGSGDSVLDKLAFLFLSNFFDVDISKLKIENYKKTTINGLNAVTLDAYQKATLVREPHYGRFAFIEGKDTYYRIIIDSGKYKVHNMRKVSDKLEESIKTFKEL